MKKVEVPSDLITDLVGSTPCHCPGVRYALVREGRSEGVFPAGDVWVELTGHKVWAEGRENPGRGNTHAPGPKGVLGVLVAHRQKQDEGPMRRRAGSCSVFSGVKNYARYTLKMYIMLLTKATAINLTLKRRIVLDISQKLFWKELLLHIVNIWESCLYLLQLSLNIYSVFLKCVFLPHQNLALVINYSIIFNVQPCYVV